MLFDILTGILSAFFIAFSLLYPLRRKFKSLGSTGKLKFHCISGCLSLLAALIHINFKIINPYFSAGFLVLLTLIVVAVTGFLKRRFMKVNSFYYVHVLFVGILVLTFLIHFAQQIINLLIM
jgi:hypothetical protein